MKVLVGLLVMAFGVFSAASGFAQTVREERRGSDDYFEFSDDDLLGGGLDPGLARIRVRPASGRVLLIRPRVSFVQRMVDSVGRL